MAKKVLCLAAFAFFITSVFAEDSITITTYYPSPYGVYKTLRLYPNDSNTPGNACSNRGEMYYDDSDNQVYVCNGVWASLSLSVPIGSIIAWHKSFVNTPALPSGWVECNGQVLSDSNSPYNGQTIPNLNGNARFLRGGSTSGTLQADELKSHTHGFSSGIGTATEHGNNTPKAGEWVDGTYYVNYTGGSETRPINMSVVWIMRVK